MSADTTFIYTNGSKPDLGLLPTEGNNTFTKLTLLRWAAAPVTFELSFPSAQSLLQCVLVKIESRYYTDEILPSYATLAKQGKKKRKSIT